LVYETTFHCILGMPKKTGFTSTGSAPAAGGVPMDLQKDRVVRTTYVATKVSNIIRYDEEYPFGSTS